jgi:Flp pilus assembly protein TadG
MLVKSVRRPRRGERGNAILEGAFVAGALFMILFAIIDFSVAILIKNTIQDAVRVGVRYAITGQTISGAGGQDNSIRQIVEQNSLGFLNAGNANLIAINYYNPATLLLVTGVNSNAAGNIVQVNVSGFSWAWMAPYGRDATPLQIAASSADIVEPNATGVPPAR